MGIWNRLEMETDMFNLKKYRLGFDVWGLILFGIIMIPNSIWFVLPAGNDILRNESITPVIDIIASIFQVIMVVALCLIKNIEYHKTDSKQWMPGIIIATLVYFLGWCMYYSLIVNAIVILILCVAPCLAFIIFSIVKKNGVAVISAIIFMICHVIYGCVNFI